ncbi:glycoside hydrolase family 27 protein [Pelomyxa schiedti]|nr:glycoside hydrolase family 27 protein [Pelomyxa schiedti]
MKGWCAAAVLTSGVLLQILSVGCVDNGVGRVPVLAWSSWNSMRFNVTESGLLEVADAMLSSGLWDAGYQYILIDDGWQACQKTNSEGHCIVPEPRDSSDRIQCDTAKFPNGMASVAQQLHAKGFKAGIYSSISEVTCGGFSGSLGHEQTDAQAFADWGFDFLKHDTCAAFCGTRNNCIQNSVKTMSEALNATGRQIVYYIDDGNPTSGMRLYNPYQHGILPDIRPKIALTADELIWVWGPQWAHMYKSWFGRGDSWDSLMDNVHMQVGNAYYQKCGAFNFLDMITVGYTGMSSDEELAQMMLYSVLASPIIIGADVRTMSAEAIKILTVPEILAVNQDRECVQGSLLEYLDAYEIWGKPLYDGRFAVVLLNKGTEDRNIAIHMNTGNNNGDFYPAVFKLAHIRDLYLQQDLGEFYGEFAIDVRPHAAVMLAVTPLEE